MLRVLPTSGIFHRAESPSTLSITLLETRFCEIVFRQLTRLPDDKKKLTLPRLWSASAASFVQWTECARCPADFGALRVACFLGAWAGTRSLFAPIAS